MSADTVPGRRQNRKRVRPPGSAAKVTIAERGSTRYTFHGGGPCEGALHGAVMPDPLSSASAGQPLSAHALATRATAPGSVTRVVKSRRYCWLAATSDLGHGRRLLLEQVGLGGGLAPELAGPPDPVAEVQIEGGDQHGSDDDGVQQYPERHREAKFGQ